MSRLSTANKPELIRYIPSGKYPSYAPKDFILSLFMFSVLTALVYGYVFGLWHGNRLEFLNEEKAVSMNALVIGMLPLFVFSTLISYKLVRHLDIRNPKLAMRWALYATVPWGIFSWIGFYLASGSEVGIINYALDRLTNGIPVFNGIGRQGGSFEFHADGPVLLIGWFLEAAIIPFAASQIARSTANFPYSENLRRWYNSFLFLPKFIRDKLQVHGYKVCFCYVSDDVEDNLLFNNNFRGKRACCVPKLKDIPIVLPEECIRMLVKTFTPGEGFSNNECRLKESPEARRAWQRYKEAKIISWSRVDNTSSAESVS